MTVTDEAFNDALRVLRDEGYVVLDRDDYERQRAENERLREGLQHIVDSDFDSGYSWSEYADAVLSGHEPLDSGDEDGQR